MTDTISVRLTVDVAKVLLDELNDVRDGYLDRLPGEINDVLARAVDDAIVRWIDKGGELFEEVEL